MKKEFETVFVFMFNAVATFICLLDLLLMGHFFLGGIETMQIHILFMCVCLFPFLFMELLQLQYKKRLLGYEFPWMSIPKHKIELIKYILNCGIFAIACRAQFLFCGPIDCELPDHQPKKQNKKKESNSRTNNRFLRKFMEPKMWCRALFFLLLLRPMGRYPWASGENKFIKINRDLRSLFTVRFKMFFFFFLFFGSFILQFQFLFFAFFLLADHSLPGIEHEPILCNCIFLGFLLLEKQFVRKMKN